MPFTDGVLMIRRYVTIIVIVGVLALVAYDASRYITEQRQLRDATYELARWGAENATRLNRDAAARELAVMGAERGVTVYQYGQTTQGVQVWTESRVDGTLVLGTVANMLSGSSFSEASSKPYLIHDYREAGL
jgi:Flp pilus assembly protein TadG